MLYEEVMKQVRSVEFNTNIFTGMNLTAIIIPDDVADEKVKALQALGAHIEKVRPASIVDKKQASPMTITSA